MQYSIFHQPLLLFQQKQQFLWKNCMPTLDWYVDVG